MKRLASLLLGTLTGAVAEEPAAMVDLYQQAARLPLHAPALQELAAAHRQDLPQIRAVLLDAAADDTARRGAARLLTAAGLAPEELLRLALDCQQAHLQGLLARGLVGKELPATQICALASPALVCQLLINAPQPSLAEASVQSVLQKYLRDAEACSEAAALVAARGQLQVWGPILIEVIASAAALPAGEDRETVVAHAHLALSLLTGSQRSLTPYAGHYGLLVQDWRDHLAARGSTSSTVDPAHAALVAKLPETEALQAILAAGQAALPAVEAAMAGAPRARRQELAESARLLSRAVSPALYAEFGASGLADIDAVRPEERLQSLRRIGEWVAESHDPGGLLHLLSWLDDPDSSLRAAALDRLVRLSDDDDRFSGGNWRLAPTQLFPPAQTTHRLRRSLNEGDSDEQVAALMFIDTLEGDSKVFQDDILKLLSSPHRAVGDTALSVMTHQSLTAESAAVLLRLAGNPQQAATRRAAILEHLLKNKEQLQRFGNLEQLRQQAESFLSDPDSLVNSAAQKLVFALSASSQARREIIEDMLGKGDSTREAAFRLLIEQVPDAAATREVEELLLEVNGQEAKPEAPAATVSRLIVPFLLGDDAAAALQALKPVHAFVSSQDNATRFVALLNEAEKEKLLGHSRDSDERGAYSSGVCLALGLGDAQQLLASAEAQPDERRPLIWIPYLRTRQGGVAALEALLAAQAAAIPVDDSVEFQVLRQVFQSLQLHPDNLQRLAAAGQLQHISAAKTSYQSRNSIQQRIFTFADGDSLTLRRPSSSRSDADWEIERLPTGPTPDLEVLAAQLTQLQLDDSAGQYRDLLLRCIDRQAPSEAQLATYGRHSEVWRLLLAGNPALRQQVIAIQAAKDSLRRYHVDDLFVDGQADALALIEPVLAADSEKYTLRFLLKYLHSLPSEQALPYLRRFAALPEAWELNEFSQLLSQQDVLPALLVLELIKRQRSIDKPVAAFDASIAEELRRTLAELEPGLVLRAAAPLRQLRAAGTEVFDPILRQLIAEPSPGAAAWLRTGIPLQAGMEDAYLAAKDSEVPELWLVGAAYALQQEQMDAASFLAGTRRLPADHLAAASLVAKRYLADRLSGHAEALAAILRAAPPAAISSWLLLVPPDDAIAAAIIERCAEPSTANLIGFALDSRLRAEPQAWRPLVKKLIEATDGKLDYLQVGK